MKGDDGVILAFSWVYFFNVRPCISFLVFFLNFDWNLSLFHLGLWGEGFFSFRWISQYMGFIGESSFLVWCGQIECVREIVEDNEDDKNASLD